MQQFDTVIVGGGPAGLTAALELARAGVGPVLVLEASGELGGISKTVNHNGNRIDIGGHRFFSKSDWVMHWWQEILPVEEGAGDAPFEIHYRNSKRFAVVSEGGDRSGDDVLLLRDRLSRIYFDGKFFDYPLKASASTALSLGLARSIRFGMGYVGSRLRPIVPERSLEDFMLNRFGRPLYEQFFREYTEKVWGVPCSSISAEWGAQRIKSLSIGKAIKHAISAPLASIGLRKEIEQTSLIEKFLYPKFGPGQMWERVGEKAAGLGVEIRLNSNVEKIRIEGGRATGVNVRDIGGDQRYAIAARNVISTMPVKELVAAMSCNVPEPVRAVSDGLQYRDFITVGLLYRKMRKSAGFRGGANNMVPDNWIYVQEPGVKVGRLQVFNNWSPYMVADPSTVWIGLEYFCQEGDDLWGMSDAGLMQLARSEMAQLGLASADDCIDGTVLKMPKAYPGYFGTYDRFDVVREWLDQIPNVFLVGRNGMHRYNNQDHSMLSAREAVRCIIEGDPDKAAIWAVNVGDDYHEQGK